MRLYSALLFVLSFALPGIAGETTTIELHILAGQSNATGYGADPAELPEWMTRPSPEIPFWFVVGPQPSIDDPDLRVDSGGDLVSLAPQHDASGATFGPQQSGFGAELLLGRTLASEGAARIAIVKFALNGSDLVEDWSPFDSSSLYHQMLAEVLAARSALELDGFEVEVASFSWMQGESDALEPGPAWLYEWNLEELILHLRADLEAPELPVQIARLNQFIDGVDELEVPYLYVVRDAQLLVHQQLPSTSLIDTDRFALGPDGLHFDAWGQVELGRHFARAVLAEVSSYCNPQASPIGCIPTLEAIGVPSGSSPAAFVLTARGLVSQSAGLFIYGFEPAATPFLGGTLCVGTPIHRTPLRASEGSPNALDCTGSFSINFSALVAQSTDPELVAGNTVYAQAWYRDPSAPAGSGLSDALSFALTP